MIDLVVRNWRFVKAEPYGMLMWFDPSIETPGLRSRNGEEASLGALGDQGVDKSNDQLYLDSMVSVSALENENDSSSNEQVIEDELPF